MNEEQTLGKKILIRLSHMGLCAGFGEIHVEAVDTLIDSDRPTPKTTEEQIRDEMGRAILVVLREEPNAAIIAVAMRYLSWDGRGDLPGSEDIPDWQKKAMREQKSLGSPEPVDDE